MSWNESVPSNWTLLRGYLRFTLHGDCGGGTLNIILNQQQIAQVSGIFISLSHQTASFSLICVDCVISSSCCCECCEWIELIELIEL
jgi:hypothetical protein